MPNRARTNSKGLLSVTGGYLNMTQLPGDAEFDAAYEQLELNPDHRRPPLEQPSGFWWEGQAGERIFTWLSTHYGFGEEWGIVDGDVDMAERCILAFLERLCERDDHPYDAALVLAANDNRWPTVRCLDVVQYWNSRHPHIRTEAELIEGLSEVDEQLLLFGEHIRGSWETYSKPHSTSSYSHWNATAGLAYEAYDSTRDLAIEGALQLMASGCGATKEEMQEHSILLVNTTESALGTVLLPIGGVPRDFGAGTCIETGLYRAVVDPECRGVVSLVDLRSGRELVDPDAGHGLGAVVIEQIHQNSQHPMVTVGSKYFHPEDPRPDFVCTAAAGSSPAPDQRHRAVCGGHLADGRARSAASHLHALPISRASADRSRRADDQAEGVRPREHLRRFPLRPRPSDVLARDGRCCVRGGNGTTSEHDQGLVFDPAPDRRDRWLKRYSVGEPRRPPLVQLGNFQTGQWARHLDAPSRHINSWVSNLRFTNLQARQDGSLGYRYRFESTAQPAPVDHESVRRYGRDLLRLLAREYTGLARLVASGRRIEPSDQVLAEVRPVGNGLVRVRVRNIRAEAVTVRVSWQGGCVTRGESEIAVDGYGVRDVLLQHTS